MFLQFAHLVRIMTAPMCNIPSYVVYIISASFVSFFGATVWFESNQEHVWLFNEVEDFVATFWSR